MMSLNSENNRTKQLRAIILNLVCEIHFVITVVHTMSGPGFTQVLICRASLVSRLQYVRGVWGRAALFTFPASLSTRVSSVRHSRVKDESAVRLQSSTSWCTYVFHIFIRGFASNTFKWWRQKMLKAVKS